MRSAHLISEYKKIYMELNKKEAFFISGFFFMQVHVLTSIVHEFATQAANKTLL